MSGRKWMVVGVRGGGVLEAPIVIGPFSTLARAERAVERLDEVGRGYEIYDTVLLTPVRALAEVIATLDDTR